MGNSTRCHAVMERLAERNVRIHVLTSGNGLQFFQDKKYVDSLTAMDSFYYSGKNGGVSGWSTFKSLGSLVAIAKAKKAKLTELLDRIHPDVAVIDSEYAIRPLRRRGIPIVALNTSEMVVDQYLKSAHVPRNVRSHFWLVELPDYLFHKHFCDLILSPFPLPTLTRHRRFKRIGLIARRSVLEKALPASAVEFAPPRQLRRVVFMLSGSVHASNIPFDRYELPFHVDVVGRPGESRKNVTYHGRQMDNTGLLARADALVINAGYSAVSEAFVLGKPVFVVPVAGHAEQFVNARLVSNLGIGFEANESDVLPRILSMYEQNRWIGLKPPQGPFRRNGAEEAAEAIVKLSRSHLPIDCVRAGFPSFEIPPVESPGT